MSKYQKDREMKVRAIYFDVEHYDMLMLYSKYNGAGSMSKLINDMVDEYISDHTEDIDRCLKIEMKK